MNGKEDFGPLVDVLVACVGAMDVISVVAIVFNLASYSNLSMDINNNDVKVMQDKSQHTAVNDTLSRSKDGGIPRVIVDSSKVDGDVIDSLVTKVNELNEKVTELVIRSRESSMERFLDAERERYRRSRSPSPINRDDVDLDENGNDNAEYDYHQSKGITRDDEFRKTIKRSSQVSSQHESREEELARLTEIEAEEMNNMDDFVPLTYQSDENDDIIIETIEEMPTCSIHGKIEEILASGSSENNLITTDISVGDAKSHINKMQDINENFIKMEKAALQQQANSSRMLTKQGNVGSNDFPDETINEIITKRDENITTEPKIVEDVLLKANVEESPKLENFPKALEITSLTNEVTSELISTLESPQKINLTNVEEFSKINVEPSIMVRSYAEILTQNESIDENVTDLKNENQVPVVEVISEPQSVVGSLMEVNVNPTLNYKNHSLGSTATPSLSSYSTTNLNVSMSSLQNKSENISLASSAFDNDFAVRRRTPDPDVSIPLLQLDADEVSIQNELLNITSPSSSGEGLKKSKRCINSLDRSASRSSSRLSQRKSKSPSVASQEDYKDWFDKFDNHLSPELTVPENNDDELFDSDMEEELLIGADDGNLDGAEICNLDEDKGNGDVSVIVTLNLKQKQAKQDERKEEEPCNPCKEYQKEKNIYKTKAEELEEMQRLWETKKRRTSILPSTDEQQKNYVCIHFHPEEFLDRTNVEAFHEHCKKEPHEHHQHMHNVGYNEWMKKIVDHHSCHLALSDSDSDSDVPLDDVKMLPLFCDETLKKRRKKK